ncbi:MAG: WYL domain-containing protein [Proteobacteria bacterium]|nr:WYL domain-containing protein [Pseudomonadota bacterium]
MPKRKSPETALRLLHLVEILKKATKDRPLTRTDIRSKLEDEGIGIDEEQIGRDIEALLLQQDRFLILNGIKVSRKKKPHTYWYQKGAQDIVSVSPELAFALKLTERYLGEFIPAKEKESLMLLFKSAGEIVGRQSNIKYKRLLERFEIFPRGYQLIPPPVNEQHVQTLLSAIALQQRVSFDYTRQQKRTFSVVNVEPLGIVDRSGILTLVTLKPDTQETRNYNISRMSNLTAGSDFSYPKQFSLKAFVEAGNMNQRFSDKPVTVRLKLDRTRCADMLESKLSADQKFSNLNDKDFEITATVPFSVELLWWVLERGRYCEVLAPNELRDLVESEG